MKERRSLFTHIRKRMLCLLFCACVCLCGCSSYQMSLLLPYSEKVSAKAENYIFREEGISNGVCVISDESVYDPNYTSAAAAVLVNLTDQTPVYSKNAFVKLPEASLTKLMTALLAIEAGDLERVVTVSDEVTITTYDAWLCGLQPGDTLTVHDLLRAALVYSGNDAASALAVAVGGDMDTFIAMMNARAEELGAVNTHFANPHGLDQDGHYSTAYDLYLIFNECLKHPEFREIIPLPSVTISLTSASGESKTMKLTSGNGYLNQTAFPPAGITAYGGKTGHTENALYCLATLASDSAGNEYAAIVLGAVTKQQVYAQTNLLFDLLQ